MSALIETYALSNGDQPACGTCAAIEGNPSRFSSWSDKLTPWAVRMPSSKRTTR